MRNAFYLGWRLLVVSLIAGVLLGAAYAVTKEPIAAQRTQQAEASRQALFPDAEFEEIDVGMVKALSSQMPNPYDAVSGAYIARANGERQGVVVEIAAAGYGGDIGLSVGIGTDEKIVGIVVGTHNETPGLGAKASGQEFAGKFAGKATPLTVTKGNAGANEIDALSGATVTSRGVTHAVNLSAKFAMMILWGEG